MTQWGLGAYLHDEDCGELDFGCACYWRNVACNWAFFYGMLEGELERVRAELEQVRADRDEWKRLAYDCGETRSSLYRQLPRVDASRLTPEERERTKEAFEKAVRDFARRILREE